MTISPQSLCLVCFESPGRKKGGPKKAAKRLGFDCLTIQLSESLETLAELPPCSLYLIQHDAPELVERVAREIRSTPNAQVSTASIIWLSPSGKMVAWPSRLVDDVILFSDDQAGVNERLSARIAQAEERCLMAVRMLDNAKSETILKQREEFLGVCAHDLRSPIGLIKVSLKMALCEAHPLSELQTELLTRAERQSVHALALVDDLLDVMAFEQGLRPQYTLVSLGQFLEDFHRDYRLQAEQKKIRFEYKNEIADWKVLIDPDRVRQMLQNIFANAVKFTPEGRGIYLSVESFQGRRKTDPQFPMVMLTLRDEGKGIPRRELAGIFDRFTQVKGMGRAEGRGLGLSVAKQIAQLHDGNVWVSSEEGAGSSFFVLFPHVVGPAEAKHTQTRILIVDPGKDHRALYEDSLARLGISPTFAKDGVEAVTLSHFLLPEIVLFASDLSKISTSDAARILKDNHFSARRVLMLGAGETPTIDTGLFDSVLTRPFSERDL